MSKQLVERRETEPHVAVLHVSWELHERLPTGELRGMCVEQGKCTLKVEGHDRLICLRKLNELLTEYGLNK